MKTKEIIICSLFASITSILSQISLPLGNVPFTLQVFAVMIISLLLDKKLSFLSMIIYILIGAIGIPAFSNFKGGFSVLLGPTGGYILSLPICAFVVSFLYEKINNNSNIKNKKILQDNSSVENENSTYNNYKYFLFKNNLLTFISMLIGLFIVYFFGTLQFMIITKNTFFVSLSICVFPFIIFDLIKIIFALILNNKIKKRLKIN